MGQILEASKTGNRREMLLALRDSLAAALDDCQSNKRDMASLSKRYMDVVAELDAMPDPQEKKNPAQAARAKVKNRGKAS